jgi:hypothetical protein
MAGLSFTARRHIVVQTKYRRSGSSLDGEFLHTGLDGCRLQPQHLGTTAFIGAA